MKYAIIAAGEGSRLASEGIQRPKPLVEVGGECLIDRLVRIFTDNGATDIVVICNDRSGDVAQHLIRLQRDGLKGRPVPVRFVVKSTPSSMHSFFEISKFLTDEPFILTTVDTVFREDEFRAYVQSFCQLVWSPRQGTIPIDGLMGVTDFVDDEKPLWVATDNQLRITAFQDEGRGCRYVSAGIYGLQPSSVFTLNNCIARAESRMRNFQRALVAEGQRLQAWPFSKVMDVDHAGDISKAEQFLAMG